MANQDQAELQRIRDRAKLIPAGVKTASEAFPGEPTVLMVFPDKLQLAVTHQTVVKFNAGPQEVPKSLIDHAYLKANGVKLFAGANIDEELEAAQKAVTEATARLEKAKAAKAAAVKNAEFMAKLNPQVPTPALQLALADMTKAELVAHAQEQHDLTLDPALKKDELISAITEAAAAKAK